MELLISTLHHFDIHIGILQAKASKILTGNHSDLEDNKNKSLHFNNSYFLFVFSSQCQIILLSIHNSFDNFINLSFSHSSGQIIKNLQFL